MTIRVNMGKWKKDRLTVLSKRLLIELRGYLQEFSSSKMVVSELSRVLLIGRFLFNVSFMF